MKIQKASLLHLDCGLRLVHVHMRGTAVGIFGIAVRAGSANEEQNCYGLAHLVEHTIFKGTEKRSSWHIINRMEAVGGELNAFTTKEETTVYSIFPSGNAARAIELIADLAISSKFPEREIEKEKDVVLDEIDSYRDTPSEAVFDDFEDLIFADTSLGHNILGTHESVKELSGADCRAFTDKYYNAANMVAYYSGPQSIERIAGLVAHYFSALPSGSAPLPTEPLRYSIEQKCVSVEGLHQAHVVLGVPAASLYSHDRYTDSFFANLIGGPGMNSLLNIELRERRGLVYNVEAGVTHFSGGGLLSVYFGCDGNDKDKCLKICDSTFNRLAEMPAATLARKLTRAKRQYLGQLAISAENRENRIMALARAVLFRNELPVDNAARDAIEAISPQQITELASKMVNAAMLAYCP